MKSAGNALLAWMPPTFAAARNTNSGLSASKKERTSAWEHRSSSERVLRIRSWKPARSKRRTRADPTSPRWPAT